MSSISSVGNSSLTQWLQQLAGNQQTSNTSNTNSASSDTTASAIQDPFQFLTGGTQGAGRHHHHGGRKFLQQIESSVTSALQNAPAGSDPNTVVKDAIAQALQGSQSGSSTQAAGASNDGDGDDQKGVAANGSSSGSTTLTAAGSSGGFGGFLQLLQSYGVGAQQFQQDLQTELTANQTNGTSTSASPLAADNAAFSQLLQSYGVSSQQFEQDLQAALAGNQGNGQGLNFASLFKSFPPGSFLQAVG